jgi:hypothetical protein
MGRGVLDARFRGHDRRVAQGPSRHLKRPSHATDSPDRRLDRTHQAAATASAARIARAEKQKFVRRFRGRYGLPDSLERFYFRFTEIYALTRRIPLR